MLELVEHPPSGHLDEALSVEQVSWEPFGGTDTKLKQERVNGEGDKRACQTRSRASPVGKVIIHPYSISRSHTTKVDFGEVFHCTDNGIMPPDRKKAFTKRHEYEDITGPPAWSKSRWVGYEGRKVSGLL